MRVHQPPTMWFGGGRDWNDRAIVAVEALEIYESSLCHSCSQSAFHAVDPRNSGEFEVKDDVVCLGCEAIEMHGDAKTPPGAKTYIHNSMSDD